MAMQPNLAHDLLRMFTRQILDEVFEGETGASRLQQVGLFTLIFSGGEGGQPLTAAQLSELTGQDAGQIGRLVQKLMARGLVERKPGPGRGRPQVLSVKPSPAAKKLIEAMTKG
jgi:DNA-binding MarR family transcriptional regulator